MPRFAQPRVKYVALFAHSYSVWLSQCKFGHFHLILAQQPCLSKIMFFLTLKNVLNLAISLEYSFLSSSETLVEASASSISSPIQYTRALICLTSSSAERPESSRNCSNRRFYCGHSSGRLNGNEAGGSIRRLFIPILSPCSML